MQQTSLEIILFKTKLQINYFLFFSVLRIEFNHSKLEYYTGIDAVLLVGTEQSIKTHVSSSNKFLNSNSEENNDLSSPIVLGKITQQVVELNLHNIPSDVS